VTVPGFRFVRAIMLEIWVWLTSPGGQLRILEVHVGGGEFQLNIAPGGIEVRGRFTLLPEQIVFE